MVIDQPVAAGADDRTIADLRHLLDTDTVSAEDLAVETCRRLDEEHRDLNAVLAVTVDRATTTARRSDRARAAGQHGPLLGIPYGVKDIIDVRGMRTTCGCAAAAEATASVDARVVELLERAGATLVGKFALAELIGLATTDPSDSLAGPIKNPWDRTRWAGGSSGGSAVAVAVGLVPFALGSETAGSIGAPAAWCGVTGLRPSVGAVSCDGVKPLSPTLDKVGVFARSAADCEIVFDVVAESDSDRLKVDASTLRVGHVASDFQHDAPPAIRQRLADALEVVDQVAALVESPGLPPQFPYRETLDVIMQAEAWASFAAIRDSGRLDLVADDDARAFLGGAPIAADRYARASDARRSLIAQMTPMFDTVDIVMTTNFALPWPMPALGDRWTPITIGGGNTAMVWASNLAGLPAVFIPVGLADGLPVSVQFVGPTGSEHRLLALAQSVQKETSWHRLRPPLQRTA